MQSHKNVRWFTRQLAWAIQERNRHADDKGAEGEAPEEMQSSALAGTRFVASARAGGDEDPEEHEEATAAPEEPSTEPAEKAQRSGDVPELAEGSAEHGEEPRPEPGEADENDGEEQEEEEAAGEE